MNWWDYRIFENLETVELERIDLSVRNRKSSFNTRGTREGKYRAWNRMFFCIGKWEHSAYNSNCLRIFREKRDGIKQIKMKQFIYQKRVYKKYNWESWWNKKRHSDSRGVY